MDKDKIVDEATKKANKKKWGIPIAILVVVGAAVVFAVFTGVFGG